MENLFICCRCVCLQGVCNLRVDYILQDSQTPEVREMLGFSCVAPIRTVHELLDEHGVLDLLRDTLITTATQEIIAEKKSRREIQREIRAKERAIETLSAKYRREPRLTRRRWCARHYTAYETTTLSFEQIVIRAIV